MWLWCHWRDLKIFYVAVAIVAAGRNNHVYLHINHIETHISHICVIYVLMYMYVSMKLSFNWLAKLNGWITITWLCEVSFDWNSNKMGFFFVWYKIGIFWLHKIGLVCSYWAEVFFSLMFSFLVLRILPLFLYVPISLILFFFYFEIKSSTSYFVLSISLPSYKKAKYYFLFQYCFYVIIYKVSILF